ncbi:hypothetical protein C1646_666012 [Rhizophagus diaphanus]|nr:hypothetical protein C1646_666012 [Rhizophagus diaphanus] [Rhizophagus sp. MUCL 43196]
MSKFTKLTFVCVLVLVLLVSFSVSSPERLAVRQAPDAGATPSPTQIGDATPPPPGGATTSSPGATPGATPPAGGAPAGGVPPAIPPAGGPPSVGGPSSSLSPSPTMSASGTSPSATTPATGAAYKIESGLSSVVALAALVGYFL